MNRPSNDSGSSGYWILLLGLAVTAAGVYRFLTESVVQSHATATEVKPYGKMGKVLDRIIDR